jgi:hypothetical protein
LHHQLAFLGKQLRQMMGIKRGRHHDFCIISLDNLQLSHFVQDFPPFFPGVISGQ